MESLKRRRSPSVASSDSDSPSSPESPSTKVVRAGSPTESAQWTCTLPPSCDSTSSTHPTLASLEAHHRTYHAHVCVADPPTFEFAIGRPHAPRRDSTGRVVCGRVFPDERFLQLHLVECHDEMAQLKRERGDKIFECFLSDCPARFRSPRGRRLHLIEKHAYPPQYFFAVTVWGIEEVLKKGGGMVRRDWTPRPGQSAKGSPRTTRGSSEESFGSQPSPASMRLTSHSPPPPPPHEQSLDHSEMQTEEGNSPTPQTSKSSTSDVDDLTAALSGTSISLVPRSVRLARKAKMPIDAS